MSQQYSSRYQRGNSSNRGHVRKPTPEPRFPTWFIGIALVVAAVASVFIVQSVLDLFGDEVADATQSNRTWLTDVWTQSPPSNSQIAQLVQRLRTHDVKAIYVQTGAWRQDGEYRAWPNAADFRAELNNAYNDVDILIWIWYEPSRHANPTSQDSLVAYARTAIEEWGYDGLHLQGYSVFNNSASYLAFVERLRDELPDGSILSITAPPDHNPANATVPLGPGNPDLSWSTDYKGQIARAVDELVIMPHAAGLETPQDYEDWVAYQVESYARALARADADVDVIVAFPAYPQELFHDPEIETVINAASGARTGISNAGSDANSVIGGGIYVYDTSTDEDWAAFAGFWLDD